MECFGRAGDRSCGRSSRSTLRTIRAIPQCAQHLASLLKVTAPEKRGPLARETIGLVCCQFPVSDSDARGRRHTAMGAPKCLEFPAVIEPMNHRARDMRRCHRGEKLGAHPVGAHLAADSYALCTIHQGWALACHARGRKTDSDGLPRTAPERWFVTRY